MFQFATNLNPVLRKIQESSCTFIYFNELNVDGVYVLVGILVVYMSICFTLLLFPEVVSRTVFHFVHKHVHTRPYLGVINHMDPEHNKKV